MQKEAEVPKIHNIGINKKKKKITVYRINGLQK